MIIKYMDLMDIILAGLKMAGLEIKEVDVCSLQKTLLVADQRNQLNMRGQLNVRNLRSQQSVQNTPHVQGRRKVHLGQNYLGSSFLSSNRVKPTINIRWLVFYCEKSGGILACEPVN